MKLIVVSMLLMFSINIVIVYSYSPDTPTHVHQYITNESKEVWKLLPHEIKSNLFNSLGRSISDTDYDIGDDIISGSGEEDRPSTNTLNHLWDSDILQTARGDIK